MLFHYITRTNPQGQLEYFEGMYYKSSPNKMKAHWSSHSQGGGSMRVSFHKDETGFDEIMSVYSNQFIGATIRTIELDV